MKAKSNNQLPPALVRAKYYSPRDVAEILNVRRQSVYARFYQWAAEGRARVTKAMGLRINADDFWQIVKEDQI